MVAPPKVAPPKVAAPPIDAPMIAPAMVAHPPDMVLQEDLNQDEKYLGGTGFQMPDNFDLPDEIIQGQLPMARYTSTPIRYAKQESDDEMGDEAKNTKASENAVGKAEDKKEEVRRKKTEPEIDSKERVKPKKFSLAQDLAEKRQRMVKKLRGDFDIPPPSQKRNLVYQKRTKSEPKTDDETEGSEFPDSSDELPTSTRKSDKSVPSKPNEKASKMQVSIQNEGIEEFMELNQYRLKLMCRDSSETDKEKEERRKRKKKRTKLEKVGKRIKRMVSDDSDDPNDHDQESSVSKNLAEIPPQEKKFNPSITLAKLPRM